MTLRHVAVTAAVVPCRPYVLPDSYVWPLIDHSNLGIEVPQGMLFINLIEATHVPRMDLFSDSDGFVKCAHYTHLRSFASASQAAVLIMLPRHVFQECLEQPVCRAL